MRGKRAKGLRNAGKFLMYKFVEARVLSPKDMEGLSLKEIINTLPKRMLMQREGRQQEAFGTQRFFNRIVKKYPNITYKELDDFVYNK